MNNWKFWVDRGGTFTDILAISPDQQLHSAKYLSEAPDHYEDAVLFGIEQCLQQAGHHNNEIDVVKMGTTVATNALLERRGEKTLMAITQGFGDLLTIRSQHRSHLFRQHIEKEKPLYKGVIEIEERIDAHGKITQSLNKEKTVQALQSFYDNGFRSIAIILMHSCTNAKHEKAIASLAKNIGYEHISLSHEASPFPKILPRAETTVADAYLSPVLQRYLSKLQNRLGQTPMLFMQSNGDLTDLKNFHGKDAVLSGPAGGIVAMARTAEKAGFDKVIGFDMGGTSTDVSLFTGQFEISQENEIAQINLRAPMLAVHTVAAGGGSRLWFDGQRFRVGPESSGAYPGPVSYGKNGHLSVTDINVLCKKIRPKFFPKVFGEDGQQPVDTAACAKAFEELTEQVNKATQMNHTPLTLASDFLKIAVNSMANAIKTISTQKGIELNEFAINAFGGAGGQHACLVAEELGIKKVFVHSQSSLLSAFGMGCSYIGKEHNEFYGTQLTNELLNKITTLSKSVIERQEAELLKQGSNVTSNILLHIHYENSEQTIILELSTLDLLKTEFEQQHQQQFGFINESTPIIIKQVDFKSTLEQPLFEEPDQFSHKATIETHDVWFNNQWLPTQYIPTDSVTLNEVIAGPAILFNQTTTLVIEPNWQAKKIKGNHFILEQVNSAATIEKNDTQLTPTRLEIFNNLYMYIAEQMGAVLQKTAHSVNIKERLDFSCAIFNNKGDLIANAPHMPVHLGSMSDSVRHIIHNNSDIKSGDCFMLNSPYHGGTHLPDITLVSPVFIAENLHYWVASRGHHADIGGTTPGSMPASSQTIAEEGVLIDNFKLVSQGKLNIESLRKLLLEAEFPARNFEQTLADLKAQIAANQRGIKELLNAAEHYGNQTVSKYMDYVQDNAEQAIKQAIKALAPGTFEYPMDFGAKIQVAINKVDDDHLEFDFTGSSEQQSNNFNAPLSVTRAAVLYVLRSLVTDDIPLNEGCLRPVSLIVPEKTMLNPKPPAAVVAGNVETSQIITDAIFGALKLQAGAQGTMNNFTFGNKTYQYYETIAGGSGAGNGYSGTDGVQTHMTNSRITDAEVIEQRYPVVLEEFSVRKNSGGHGKYSGGEGLTRRFRFLEPMTVSILSNNRKHGPFGLAGGNPGAPGSNKLLRSNGETQTLTACCEVNVNVNDRLEIKTPGGGGYGEQ
ncbi:hydantoinase B/oxoprolinase family protein [Pleionea sediminis]|uniref:hydantoinase B/oxoprolinase family protein n=1 Tax=Pleionea sediminis TaxID=2569479 RepID=UPI001185A708|nr:hydantoinase B/oxoprolinase family protein [Pleionea sediminis]